MDNQIKLNNYKAKIKEFLSKNESLKGSIVTVGFVCNKTLKQYTVKIKID
jgi:hypothetical protein